MHQVVNHYETLATLSGKMREAANQGEWDKLIEFEHEYNRLIADINSSEEIPEKDAASRQRAAQLIREVLDDDADIRNLTKNWLAQLQNIMQSNRQEQRLNQTYGAN